jgi:hypothetical protein
MNQVAGISPGAGTDASGATGATGGTGSGGSSSAAQSAQQLFQGMMLSLLQKEMSDAKDSMSAYG